MPPSSEIKELMDEYDLGEEETERLKELMDELDLGTDDALDLMDGL